MPDLAKRLEAAVSALVGEGSVKERLVAAYSEYLDDLESSELPQAVRATFDELHTALHAVTPIGGEPCVRATVRKMSKLQVSNYGKTIVSLYAELICQGERAEPLMVIAATAEVEEPTDPPKSAVGNLQKQ